MVVDVENKGKRLDMFLAESESIKSLGISRTHIKKFIEEGLVRLTNYTEQLKPHYKIKSGDEFLLIVPDQVQRAVQSEDIPLEVVYEDEDLAIINKQIGLVVHPAPGNYEHTLVNALLHRFKELSDVNPERPGIVHRLDKDTSGLIVVAKNNTTHLALARQFEEHSIQRRYVALVKGVMEYDEDIIELPIGRHPHRRTDMTVSFAENSRYAKSRYRTLQRGTEMSLVEVELFTGRTHQVRVHLSHIGHPILGDPKYGRDTRFWRLALHARFLSFVHPRSQHVVEFSTGIPEEFTEFLT